MDEEGARAKNRERQRRWLAKPGNKKLARQRAHATFLKKKRWFNHLKSGLKCARCGESRSAALDFHHISGEKKLVIGQLAGLARKETILAEIAKCEVICSNCHRVEHLGLRIECGD